ncbi:hypothetical protein [Sphingomonas sp.]|uniref:hypothetical protein n=1 Tax=Sphingomonas sp. TaxID=28214 RepID=UPI0025ECBDAC|nr:hypothetical protein [Sphingomonas sp.]
MERSSRLNRSTAKCGRNSETTRLIASLHDQRKAGAATLPDEFDEPARPPHAGNDEAFGRRTRNPPAGPRRGRFGKWIVPAPTPTTKQQHGQVGIGRGQLQSSGRDHRQATDLADDGSRRPVADCVFDDGEQRRIVARMGVDEIAGGEPRLSEAWRVKVSPGAGPQHGTTEPTHFSGGDPGQEQRGSRLVGQAAAGGGGFMQRARAQPPAPQAPVDRIDLELHHPVFARRRE